MTPEERKSWEYDGDLAGAAEQIETLRSENARLKVLLEDMATDLEAARRAPCEGVIIGRETMDGCMDARLGGF